VVVWLMVLPQQLQLVLLFAPPTPTVVECFGDMIWVS
jgi:hypothetical protein